MLQCTRLPESPKGSCVERIFNWLSNSVAFAFDLEAEIKFNSFFFRCFSLDCSYHKSLFWLWAHSRKTQVSWKRHRSARAFAPAQKAVALVMLHLSLVDICWLPLRRVERVIACVGSLTHSPCQGDVVKIMEHSKGKKHATGYCHQHSGTLDRSTWLRIASEGRIVTRNCAHDVNMIQRRRSEIPRRLCRNSATDWGGSALTSSPPAPLKTLSTSKMLRNSLARPAKWESNNPNEKSTPTIMESKHLQKKDINKNDLFRETIWLAVYCWWSS